LEGDAQNEIQSVQVDTVPRLNEVQKLGVVVSNINTAGDGVQSTAFSRGLGRFIFTVSFYFDNFNCGGGSGSVNYCQLAFSLSE
jgi:hypothetical protein